MRVIFLGTPEFAVPSLQALVENSFEICLAVTQPDRPSGRGQKLRASPIKEFAQSQGIPVFQPAKIRAEENRAFFEGFRPDFLVVVAFGQILPGWLLRTARTAPVNIHASLLPKYRGAAPVVWTILNGDRVAGVTTMLMDEHMDTGPILLKREVPVKESMTAGELSAELSAEGASLLIATLDGLSHGSIRPQVQDDSQATLAPKVTKEAARISWEQSAPAIHNQIRAFNPWPLAFTSRQGRRVQILRSTPAGAVLADPLAPGSFLGATGSGLRVQCGQGTVLELLEIRIEGKNSATGREFAAGYRLRQGDLLFGDA
jgi:methionyl-tRNA formyltransferase